MTAPLRVLIADDEPAARRTIQLLLAGDPELQVLGECTDGAQTVDAILQLHPDLVFLDVQMPRRNGFDVLAHIPASSMPLIIFVTAFDEYSLRAFDVHAADYLLKPFSDSRFREAVQHAKERLRQRSAADLERLLTVVRELGTLAEHRTADAPAPGQECLGLRTGSGVAVVRLADIEWIEARGDYVRVHSAGRTDLVRDTIGGFERQLPRDRFVRVHRSAIVNVASLREIRPLSSGGHVAILGSGSRCRLSRSGRERLGRLLGQVL